MTKLLIIGAGGHGRVVADCAEAMNYFSEIVFTAPNYPSQQHNLNWPVIGNDDYWRKHFKEYQCIVAIGDNNARANVTQQLLKLGGQLATLIHPKAVVSKYATIGHGSVVFANAVVNAGSTLGKGIIINTGATVDHDCTVNDFCHIAPGVNISGTVTIGAHTWIGVGAAVIQQVTIGGHVMVGAGSTVINDLAPHATYVGSPAKQIIK